MADVNTQKVKVTPVSDCPPSTIGYYREVSGRTAVSMMSKCLIDLCLSRKEKLYYAYIDYATAFDKIDRIALWNELLKSNNGGKLLKVIQSMYVNINELIFIIISLIFS